jgi:hypothetical protein
MKRSLIFILSIIFSIVLCSQIKAEVAGLCSNCHTMHNSQGGADMAQELSGSGLSLTWAYDATPNPSLLMYSCVGCHTNLSNTTIDNDVPIVFNTDSPTAPLAGGNFYYVLNDGDNRGHNVLNIVGQGALGLTPPGGSALSAQLRCAGTYGCHGNRGATDQVDAMKGAHHTDDTGGITGGSVGLSYRFLAGIEGVEDDDYEQETTIDKNYYKGADNSDADDATISYLCNNCHGDFHDRADISDESPAATPWLRHPTDYLLPRTGEYSSYDPTTTYENKAPVAWTDPSSRSRSTAVVMCLSCHRAHASPNYKMIRWDYASTTLATALSGCNVCHTSKN